MEQNKDKNPLIEADKVSVYFGEIAAIKNLALNLYYHQRIGLVGPNGCGKTTLLNLFLGGVRKSAGSLKVLGKSIGFFIRQNPHQLTAAGIGWFGRGFQSPFLIKDLSVEENCRLAAWGHAAHSPLKWLWPKPISKNGKAAYNASWALDLLEIPKQARHQKPGSLPFGTRKLVEVARVLATKPRFLFLDEPTSGLSRKEADLFCSIISGLKDPGNENEMELGYLVVDHDMKTIESLCQDICLMGNGNIISRKPTKEMLESKEFHSLYLGESN